MRKRFLRWDLQLSLCRDNDKTTFVMSRSRENYVVITRKQDRKIIIMHGRLELPYTTLIVPCLFFHTTSEDLLFFVGFHDIWAILIILNSDWKITSQGKYAVIWTDNGWFVINDGSCVWVLLGCSICTHPLKLATSVALYCVIKLHILEWPFIVASLRHTCAVIMLSNQHLDLICHTCDVDGLSRQRSAH